ncbi:MAG TPA: hypothetical protein VFG42_11720 [Baekduia sp.]|uniref:hypothetical protein n=1 Tax=Baekduia sp. TaxID=2600305 RepID=UPI002D76CC69|nr:hypothetical protein [Baekduia sp.]HET6507447.1 hypothetical protein [Baekduia sp.]
MPFAHVVVVAGTVQTAVTSTIAWLFMVAFGIYRLRRYRAGTLEREALARMRIAHARRTGDLRALEAAARPAERAVRAGREAG